MEDKITPEELKMLREFKSRLFDLYWEKFGFFYIHVMPHSYLEIGSRGLVGKESESGIVLAFGPTACREISSQEEYLYAELQFGFKWEKLIVPWDSIFRIFDKAHSSITQLRVVFDEPVFTGKGGTDKKPKDSTKTPEESKVISIDFTAKKK